RTSVARSTGATGPASSRSVEPLPAALSPAQALVPAHAAALERLPLLLAAVLDALLGTGHALSRREVAPALAHAARARERTRSRPRVLSGSSRFCYTRSVRLCVLASGSGGNTTFIEAGGARVLVDAGLSYRETRRRCAQAGVDLSELTDPCLRAAPPSLAVREP